ncbi:MAG: hypothetical protein B7Z83_04660 [Thiomonas sp. 20-64-5]|nr:MAG: hypothetical protein B7Z83_04660 [Thiomonas sp. 20-64-5]
MKSTSTQSSRTAQSLAAALIFAAGMTSVYAAESAAPAAPSKAMCEKEAKAQGLTGEKEQAFVDQCMHGG